MIRRSKPHVSPSVLLIPGALAALGNLFMAYTTGEPADYVVPAKPATALGGR